MNNYFKMYNEFFLNLMIIYYISWDIHIEVTYEYEIYCNNKSVMKIYDKFKKLYKNYYMLFKDNEDLYFSEDLKSNHYILSLQDFVILFW